MVSDLSLKYSKKELIHYHTKASKNLTIFFLHVLFFLFAILNSMTTVQFAQRSTNFAPELRTPITSERKREKNLLEDAHVSSQLGAKSFHGQAIRFTDFFFYPFVFVKFSQMKGEIRQLGLKSRARSFS